MESVEKDPFTEFMNEPIEMSEAEIRLYGARSWVYCPYCLKRQFPITSGARIKGQIFICKASKCKREFMVNV